ncbi:hypothetical protein Q8W71_09345 [Methylobacterium sp. NEAU 140]|uniref:hypothetical protein n=1 Tax=Methylobacterium sp. NEAU 140 TaxID=3064945 RepID=UPI0027327DB2|nr:hypothetical protein [Methylobacterium sp. NEAU 140]MDP4022825.1 hypothetical protein [Methylobacterium sp. NEAU 140]
MSLALLALAGCGDKVVDTGDDQLTALFADRTRMFGGEAEEARITRQTLDCVRLIGGLDAAIYKDAPAEMLGALRTGCRRSLQERLNDPVRNPMGFTLADLESSKAGERVAALHARLEQAYRTAAEARLAAQRAEQERKAQEARAKTIRDFEERRQAVQRSVEQVEAVMRDIAPACAENDAARQQAVAASSRNRFRWSQPFPCGEASLRSIRDQVARVRTELDRIEPDAATRPGAIFALPQLYGNNPDQLQGRLSQIRAQTAEMRAAAH